MIPTIVPGCEFSRLFHILCFNGRPTHELRPSGLQRRLGSRLLELVCVCVRAWAHVCLSCVFKTHTGNLEVVKVCKEYFKDTLKFVNISK